MEDDCFEMPRGNKIECGHLLLFASATIIYYCQHDPNKHSFETPCCDSGAFNVLSFHLYESQLHALTAPPHSSIYTSLVVFRFY